jgi:hypothetical protein
MTMVLSPDRRAQQQRHDRAERAADADGDGERDADVEHAAGANGDTAT